MEPNAIQIEFTNRDLRRLIVPLVIEQLLAIPRWGRRPSPPCPWWTR